MYSRSKSKRHGFSLLEIMAVVVIMGLLVGAVSIVVRGQIGRARQTRVKADLVRIVDALEQFNAFEGRYPTEEEGLNILSQKAEGGEQPLLSKKPMDPWGNRYEYQLTSDASSPYVVTCYGSDGLEGGEGAATDLTNLDLDDTEE